MILFDIFFNTVWGLGSQKNDGSFEQNHVKGWLDGTSLKKGGWGT